MTLGENSSLIGSNLGSAGIKPAAYLVGRVSVLDDAVSANNDGVNALVLEERADHCVACC